ncbi:MAG: hypothetical protein M1834_002464 [Cirrosporium novae-zelandiae]|nr:MAG: hypothetical protein M1834_002464 [Cirrosporium novae-zelandiae]
MATPSLPSRSNQACRRCYTRKKKCDRLLPRCSACQKASVYCSLEDKREETAVYNISYVHGLERRVKELTRLLTEQLKASSVSSDGNTVKEVSNYQNTPPTPQVAGIPIIWPDERTTWNQQTTPTSSLSPAPSSQQEGTAGNKETRTSLASELQLLSLEATAERYLGSSSGVSFARLTQAVLRRLKPDQYPFGFELSSSSTPSNHLYQQPTGSEQTPVADLRKAPSSASSLRYPSCLPSEEQAFRLADYYWTHSHTLYPFVRKVWFMKYLKMMYSHPDDPTLQSHSWLFTMWMVFAIGSTSFSSIMLLEEAEPVYYFDRAMLYFDGAISYGNMAALDAILLQVSYSFFNKVGPNTWYLVGVALRIATGVGLHTNPVRELPVDVQEYRKRLFFSLYMMDRVVSLSLGRPLGIRDEDIEIEPFSDVDDENILPDIVLPQQSLKVSTMAVPLHILALRKIAGEIFERVYSNRSRSTSPTERDIILKGIHEKLIDWRRNMPFPLPQSRSLGVPHLTTNWFDLNYYIHVLMLYRPSPLCPVLTVEKVTLIADASSKAIRQVEAMYWQRCFSFNWLNLFTVFTSTLTLIYSITAQPEALSTYLQHSDALADLEVAADLLKVFGNKFPSALKCRDIVWDVLQRLQAYVNSRSDSISNLADSEQTSSSLPKMLPTTTEVHTPPQARPVTSHSEGTQSSYPTFATGNPSYDELQHQVRGSEDSSADMNSVVNLQYATPRISESGLPRNLRIPPTTSPFGDVTAQFVAAGLGGFGTSTEMDLGDDFLDFLGGRFES